VNQYTTQQPIERMQSFDGKQSVGVLFRQVKEAHKQKLIHEYKFHESQLLGHNQSSTIAVTIYWRPDTTHEQKHRVIQYIREKFRVLTVSQPDRSPMVATIVLTLIPDLDNR